MMPDAIDQNPSGERVLGLGQVLGQSDPSAGFGFIRFQIDSPEEAGDIGGDRVASPHGVASMKQEGWFRLGIKSSPVDLGAGLTSRQVLPSLANRCVLAVNGLDLGLAGQ